MFHCSPRCHEKNNISIPPLNHRIPFCHPSQGTATKRKSHHTVSTLYGSFITEGECFLGRFDMGRPVIRTTGRDLIAGFIVSDKIILGANDCPLLTYLHGDEETYTNISFCQSLFNLHQFGKDNAIDHFVLPLFTELQITYQLQGGTYLRSGAIFAAFIDGVPADARFNVWMGYTFRYN